MSNSKTYGIGVAAITALCSSGSYGQVQVLEEILVTAQKRAQSINEVPIAISAVSEEVLDKTGVNTVTEIIPMVPGLTGADYGLATNTWALRGISSNDWTIGSEPAVGVFFDDAYIGRNMFATSSFFDVNRIEVVKGPQGTLFGRNAAAGAISLVSNKPSDENELTIGLGLGNEGQERYELVGNWAITDTFAVRLAYQDQQWQGMWKEVVSGEEMYTKSEVVRLTARWNLSDDFEALLRFNYSDAKTNYTGAVNVTSNLAAPAVEYPDQYAINNPNYEQNKDDGFGVRLNWDLNDSLTLVSITDVRSGENHYYEDADGTADDLYVDEALFQTPGGAVGGLDIPVGLINEADTFYQEFRLNGGTDTFNWFTGVSYYVEELETPLWDVNYVATAIDFPIGSQRIESEADNESYGIYGDATWAVTDRLALIGGLRWSVDDKDWCTNTPQDDFYSMGGPTAGALCESEEWDNLTSRLVAQYDVAGDTMVFVSVSEGFKGGGFNTATYDSDGDFIADTVDSFAPETSLAYELGIKSSLLEGSLQLNASAFLTDYEALQIATFSFETGQQISNAGDAETKGIEAEVSYSPIDGAVLMANYTYLDAELTSGVLQGNRLQYAPDSTFSLGANIDHCFAGGNLNWFAVYSYQDSYYHDLDNFFEEDGYGLLNGKVTYTPSSEGWDIAIAADNITNQDYAALRSDFGWGPMLHWGTKRMVRAEFNVYF